jgi:hypothetical protein
MAGGVLGICNLCVTLKANNLAAKKLGFFFAPLATAGKKLGAPKRLPPSQTLRSLLLLLLLLLLALIFPQPIAPTMQRLRKQPTKQRWHIYITHKRLAAECVKAGCTQGPSSHLGCCDSQLSSAE